LLPSSLLCSSPLHCSPPPPSLLSFPTRRSSDLIPHNIRRCNTRNSAFPDPILILLLCPHISAPLSLWWYTARQSSGNRCSPYTTDRKSTRLNSSHVSISYAVFCLKNKNKCIHF